MHAHLFPVRQYASTKDCKQLQNSYVQIYDMLCAVINQLKLEHTKSFINYIDEWNNLYNKSANQHEFEDFKIIKSSPKDI